ncbi:hypothetical protein O7622_26735 [Micromonospora sp. WMMD1076]|uniref:hypothetical protein n=1 Tax=Micromonospora sp. WMMD1076 TaxID=3016103 RepID=UPI00249A4381|nr:hypothetical protein [Micromonospora sp. WMMD1076]WFF06600.1 hypothetical protein O7622_26735 [Micromonospora sp. WMMD1076]
MVIRAHLRKAAHTALVFGLAVGGLSLAPNSPASAASADCVAKKDVKAVDWAPDPVRVIARCSHIAGGTEARGFLDMLACCDKETSWFTTKNKDYYSDYATGNFERVGINLRDI